MSHKHLIIYGLIGGALLGYFAANTLVAYQPWKKVSSLVP